MTNLYAQLEDANWQVAEAQQRIEEQRIRVLELEREGAVPIKAAATLRRFEMALAHIFHKRERLLHALVTNQR
jgi:hypothetical protein